jgi:hypothetical protein
VPETLISLADWLAVSDDTPAVEHPAEKVGHMPYPILSLMPGQFERLSDDPGNPDVTVGLDDVMALQPRLVDDMRPVSSRPPPAREVALPPVCRRLTEWPRPAEVDRGRILKSDGVTTVAVVGVNKLDAVGQFAGHYRQMTVAVCDMQLVRYHTFDGARKQVEISLDTP